MSRPSSSFARGFALAIPLALIVWLLLAIVFLLGGSLVLWVVDLPLMPWSPR